MTITSLLKTDYNMKYQGNPIRNLFFQEIKICKIRSIRFWMFSKKIRIWNRFKSKIVIKRQLRKNQKRKSRVRKRKMCQKKKKRKKKFQDILGNQLFSVKGVSSLDINNFYAQKKNLKRNVFIVPQSNIHHSNVNRKLVFVVEMQDIKELLVQLQVICVLDVEEKVIKCLNVEQL